MKSSAAVAFRGSMCGEEGGGGGRDTPKWAVRRSKVICRLLGRDFVCCVILGLLSSKDGGLGKMRWTVCLNKKIYTVVILMSFVLNIGSSFIF